MAQRVNYLPSLLYVAALLQLCVLFGASQMASLLAGEMAWASTCLRRVIYHVYSWTFARNGLIPQCRVATTTQGPPESPVDAGLSL